MDRRHCATDKQTASCILCRYGCSYHVHTDLYSELCTEPSAYMSAFLKVEWVSGWYRNVGGALFLWCTVRTNRCQLNIHNIHSGHDLKSGETACSTLKDKENKHMQTKITKNIYNNTVFQAIQLNKVRSMTEEIVRIVMHIL